MIEQWIGHTPMVPLQLWQPETRAEVWVKLEGMNPGGSIKDRTALGMVLDAETRGILRPGDCIVEPTSGNTGIGLAQVAAARGYRLILTMPAQMSEERKHTLRAYGAELILTDPMGRMGAAIAEAERICDEQGAWMPNQFDNPANARAHYTTTGPEIWEQMEGRVDAFVYGSGTGGTIMGVGQYLREKNPNVQIVAVEPARSNVLSGGEKGDHGFQGMGPGFIPPNLDMAMVDRVMTVWEEDAYPLAREVATQEGLFVGMSSGAILWAALELARELGPNKRIATIACDSGAKYLSTSLFTGDRDTPSIYLPRSRQLRM
ncbi:MAG: cysteine synthase A [Deinococcaceae bacterium]